MTSSSHLDRARTPRTIDVFDSYSWPRPKAIAWAMDGYVETHIPVRAYKDRSINGWRVELDPKESQ